MKALDPIFPWHSHSPSSKVVFGKRECIAKLRRVRTLSGPNLEIKGFAKSWHGKMSSSVQIEMIRRLLYYPTFFSCLVPNHD